MSTSSMRKVGVTDLLTPIGVTTTATGDSVEPWSTNRSYEVYGTTSAGSGSAIVVVEVRNSENSSWKTMATVTLTLGTAVTSDGFVSSAAWRYVRARVTTLTGTTATVAANVGSAPL